MIFNKIKASRYIILVYILITTTLSLVTMLLMPQTIINLMKFIEPVILCNICIDNITLKQRIKLLFTYILFNFILSGLTFSIKYTIGNISVTKIYVILCSIIIFVVVYKFLIKQQSEQLKNHYQYINVTITHCNNTLNLLGYNDSGNSLAFGDEQTPVFITDMNVLSPIIKNNNITYTEINCCTINNISTIKAFKPDSIIVNNQKTNALIGISTVPLNGDFDIILNYSNVDLNETEINYV